MTLVQLLTSTGLIALIVSGVISLPMMKLLIAIKSRQTVSAHAPEGHAQKQGTPTMGGLIILVGWIAALVVHGAESGFAGIRGYLILIAGFAAIGFVDDYVVPRLMEGKRGLGWKQKLLMQAVIAAAGSYSLGVSGLGPIAGVTFFVLFFSNAFNFADGLDWLAGTILLAMLVGALLMAQAAEASTVVLVALLGGLIPFMFWNKPKAKVFMGDVGSLPIGAVLGAFVFTHFRLGTGLGLNGMLGLAALVFSFMMIVELVPVPLQIASVKLRKKKLFPYTPVHHAFEKAGWRETSVVALFAAVQLVCSFIALALFRAGVS